MTFLTDIEIAKKNTMKPIIEVATELGIDPESLDMYGKYKAKLDINELERLKEINISNRNYSNDSWRRKNNNVCWIGRCLT